MSLSCESLVVRPLVALAMVLCCTHCTTPKGYIYANNDSSSLSPYIYQIDLATGKVITTYTNLSGVNHGRGVAVIANTMYYTSGTSNCVYTYDLGTGKDKGCLFNVIDPSGNAVNGLASLAFDGTNLWIEEYSGGRPGAVFPYDITVVPPRRRPIFTPSGCPGTNPNCDGLEYAYTAISGCTGGLLISNRGDAIDPYDAYQTTPLGRQCNSPFITPANRSTGIAWDGQLFYTSDIFKGILEVFNSNGTSYTAEPTITVTGAPSGYPPVIEDLSIDYGRIYCFPPKRAVYSNGPVNGQTYAYEIDFISPVVSNSFVVPVGFSAVTPITGFCYGLWVERGDQPGTVDWSITSAPNGGVTFAQGRSSS